MLPTIYLDFCFDKRQCEISNRSNQRFLHIRTRFRLFNLNKIKLNSIKDKYRRITHFQGIEIH